MFNAGTSLHTPIKLTAIRAKSSDYRPEWRTNADAGNLVDGCLDWQPGCGIHFTDWAYIYLDAQRTLTSAKLHQHGKGDGYTKFKWQVLSEGGNPDTSGDWLDVSGNDQDANCDRSGSACQLAFFTFPSHIVSQGVRVLKTGTADYYFDGWFRVTEMEVFGYNAPAGVCRPRASYAMHRHGTDQ